MSTTIQRAVDRFLSWKLPLAFTPDCHITFDQDKALDGTWPSGTNLLHAGQAREMIEHLLGVEPGQETDFGGALLALKAGKRVARKGWNGKDMWLSLSGVANIPRDIPAHSFWSKHNAEYAAAQPGAVAKVLPCITMKTATGEILMGWLASQTDMLAEDWVVLD